MFPSIRSREVLRLFMAFVNGCDPFCGGKSTVPDHQLSLYYTLPDSDVHRRIHFPTAGTDDLAALYAACKPAPFGRGGETVFDETYRKARKMDLDSFSTLFDPRSVGIFEEVSKGLLTGKRDLGVTEMELYKLNVYGEGDFFRAHQDTPRSADMVGSLVVVLPTQHEGGQLVLRQRKREWTLDFASELKAATGPLVHFVAFFGDVEHEVLPVTSGYRVTLTYNLYCEPSNPSTTYIPTPLYRELKKALVELVNESSVLPQGGYLGCGLVHEYVYDEERSINSLLDHLKGADQILAMVCDELGLSYRLTLLYREMCHRAFNLITSTKLISDDNGCRESDRDYLEDALRGLTIPSAEIVEIIGSPFDRAEVEGGVLGSLVKDPVTSILEVRPMSTVRTETSYVSYGNEASLDFYYGHGSMLIAVEPLENRKKLVL